MKKENQNIEWKESWRDDYLKWLCGFANAQGGTLFIGIDDKGNVSGVDNSKKLLEDIPNKISNYLGIVADINLMRKDGKEYIEISVDKCSYPVSYKGEFHYRSGSTKQTLTGQALTQFLIKKSGLNWEDSIVDNINIDDFRNDSFDIFKENSILNGRMSKEDTNISKEQILEKLKLYENGKLNRAAVLLFHQDPEKWVPCSYVKIGFFEDDAEILYQDEVHGSLISQADKILDLIFTKYLVAKIGYQKFTRIDKYPYPREAIREAIFNAIVHRNYATHIPTQIRVYRDKLIISNSCILPDGWTIESMPEQHTSKPYNPLIANAFYRAGYIESWGRGIQNIYKYCKNYGIDKPLYEGDNDFVKIEFKALKQTNQATGQERTQDTPISFDEQGKQCTQERTQDYTQDEILSLIKLNPCITQKEIASQSKLNINTVKSRIYRMQKKHIIKRVGSSQKGYWKIL